MSVRQVRENSLKSLEKLRSKIQQLEKEVTCQFCLGPLEDPRMLGCLHSFCKKCIQGMQVMNSSLYKCAQCQDKFNIPDLEKLQKHDIANTKQQDLKLLRRVSIEKIKCNLCPVPHKAAAEAVYLCVDCGEGQQFICHACSSAHYTKPELQEHQLELVTTIQRGGVSSNVRSSLQRQSVDSNLCSNHGHPLQYFCQSCNTCACQECISELHKDHTIGETDFVLQELQDLIPTEMLFTVGIRDSLLSSIKPIAEAKLKIEHQKLFLSGEIHSCVLKIYEDLQRQEKILQEQLQSTAQAKVDLLSLQLTQIEKLIERADQLSQMMSNIDKITNQSDILSLSQILLKKGVELRKDFETAAALSTRNAPKRFSTFNQKPSLTPCEEPNMSFIFYPSMINKNHREQSKVFKITAYPENCSAVGPGLQHPEALKLTYFNVYLRDVHNNLCVPQQNLVVTITTEIGNDKIQELPQAIHKGHGRYMITYCPKFAYNHVINVTVNEKHIKDSPFLVTVTTPSPLADISDNFSSLEMLRKPYWLSRDSKDNVIVCDRSSPSNVLVLNEVGHEVLRIEEEQNSKLKHPCGVAVGSNNSIYICGSYCHCILKYNANGKVLQIAGKIGKGKGEFQNPAGLAVTENGEVFVCDTSNFRIQVFDEKLQYKREISTDLTRFGHQRLTRPSHPHDIAIDNSHQMFVADTNNHCILVYKSREKFSYPIWDVGENLGNLKNPRCVTVDNDGCLYVSDAGKLKYQVG